MKIMSSSKHIVSAAVYKALPYGEATMIDSWSKSHAGGQNLPKEGWSPSVPPGDNYYVYFNGTFGPVTGQLIAATGGASSDATVTLTENDRIMVT
jgi:hypothetical protein